MCTKNEKVNKKHFDVEEIKMTLESLDQDMKDLKKTKNLDKPDFKGPKVNTHFNTHPKDIFQQLLDMRFLRLSLPEFQVYYFPEAPVHHIQNIPWSSLNRENLRLRTFSRYPATFIKSSMLLAAQGFAYLGSGNDDLVICVFCGKEYKNWTIHDDIRTVHARLSPHCPMVTGNPCNNIPMNSLFSPSRAQDETFRASGALEVNEGNGASLMVPSASSMNSPAATPMIPPAATPISQPAATPSAAQAALPSSERS